MGIRKLYYRGLHGGEVLFKLEEAELSWKNCKKLTEEEVTAACAEKVPIGMDRG